MLYKHTNLVELENIVKNYEIVLVDFWADWCVPCKQFSRIFTEIASQYESLAFAQINIEDYQEHADLLHIKSIPHLLIFKAGVIIFSESGNMPGAAFRELIDQALKADIKNGSIN